jgi:alpha-galactosidase
MTGGIEIDKPKEASPEKSSDGVSLIVRIPDQHQRLLQVTLVDCTDAHNELVHVKEWLLHKCEMPPDLEGNIFVVESQLTKEGKIFVKEAPLPHVRRSEAPLIDLNVRHCKDGGYEYMLHQTGPDDLEKWHVLDFKGGVPGRTQALHNWQRSRRPQTSIHHIPQFISNTWGDRNRDARIQHDFILKEIDAAAELGVDAVQIDDGWQKGISANSAEAKARGGVWSGFWETDPEFWTPNPNRFPHGFEPILKHAAEKGVGIGLWYAPDSSNEFANWRKDADQILKLHRNYGVNLFKLDSIQSENFTACRNLRDMFKAIVSESEGRIACDLDVTGWDSRRPGYLGALEIGPIFVENRYTDWHGYWPHFTLRNLWHLSHWIDPRRLRTEFLNNERNREKYGDDPLAPALYPPATLFAITIFSNPLGWFENTGLSNAYRTEVSSLVNCWRANRDKLFAGDIHPIGDAPDGVTWTGFCSVPAERGEGYAVVFNEKSQCSESTILLPCSYSKATVLHGEGSARVDGKNLSVSIPKQFGYLFVKLNR